MSQALATVGVMKRCSECERDLPLESFSKRARAKDGLATWCKDCYGEYQRQHRAGERRREVETVAGWRRCSTCLEIKPLAQFANDPTRKHGKRSQCHICMNAHSVLRYLEYREDPAYKERSADALREYRNRPGNRERYNSSTRERRNANWERHHDQHLRRHYGITRADFLELEHQQGGRCAICGTTEVRKRHLFVDHDHETGRVRGLLCHHCNCTIGYAREDVERLRAAIRYLERGD